METKFDRRSFLRVTGTALGIGALYSVFPALTRSAGAEGHHAHPRRAQRRSSRAILVHSAERHACRIQRAARSSRHQGVRKRGRHYQWAENPARAGHRHRRPDPRRRESRRACQALQAVQGDFEQDWRRANQGRAGRERLRPRWWRYVPRIHGPNPLLVRPSRRSFHRARQRLRRTTHRRSRADRLDEVRSRALSENGAHHRVHASPAVRPQARMGLVHQRRRRRDERAGAV